MNLKKKKTKKRKTLNPVKQTISPITFNKKIFSYIEKTFGTLHALNILMVSKGIRPAYYNTLKTSNTNLITDFENIIKDLNLKIKYTNLKKKPSYNDSRIRFMIYKRGEFDMKNVFDYYNTGKFLGYPCPSNLIDIDKNKRYSYQLKYWKKNIYKFDVNENKIIVKTNNVASSESSTSEIFTFICDKNSKSYTSYMVDKGNKLKKSLEVMGINDIDIITIQRHKC